jgi:hypothetical protein
MDHKENSQMGRVVIRASKPWEFDYALRFDGFRVIDDRADDRRALNGIFWILRAGAPWRDLAERYGPYNRTVFTSSCWYF